MASDPANYIKFLEHFAVQCREALALPKGMAISGEINNIVVCGMGGSAIGGDILKAYMGHSHTPVFVCRNYELPAFADEHSLVFCVSYSGNTEETLACFKQAQAKRANVWAFCSGGKLAEVGKKTIKIPSGLQPRAALGYLFFPMLGLLHNSNLIEVKNAELNEMLTELRNVEEYRKNGEMLARKLENKIPVIYSSVLMGAAAYRWKTQINENAKQPAFFHVFPEMNHNELVGYQSMKRELFQVILLRDKSDPERIKKRMDIFKELAGHKADIEEVHAKGTGLLCRIFSLIYYGDFASYYLALRNRVDPTPVAIIEELKKRMAG